MTVTYTRDTIFSPWSNPQVNNNKIFSTTQNTIEQLLLFLKHSAEMVPWIEWLSLLLNSLSLTWNSRPPFV